jgi:hypothetical protein
MTGRTFRVTPRQKFGPGLFWQFTPIKPGETFEHRGTEYCVDNVVASPPGGFEVQAHPTMQFRVDETGERCE